MKHPFILKKKKVLNNHSPFTSELLLNLPRELKALSITVPDT